MPTLKRIPIDELSAGMVIIRSDKPGIIFDEYGIPLSSDEKIQQLKDNGVTSVFIWDKDTDKKEAKNTIIKDKADTAGDSSKIVDAKIAIEIPENQQNTVREELLVFPKPEIDINSQRVKSLSFLNKSENFATDYKQKNIVNTAPKISSLNKDKLSTDKIVATNTLIEKSRATISASLASIKRGEKVKVAELTNVIHEMVEATLLYPGVFTNVARLEEMGDAEYTHGFNVAVLSISIGQTIGLKSADLITLGIAGLLHDVGKSRIPDKLLQKTTKLSDQEFHIVSKHPEWSQQILAKNSDIPPEALAIVLHHHEKLDGSGYPSQLTASYLSLSDMIVGIAEDYDTMIGGGMEEYPILHSCEAVRRIYKGLDSEFSEEIVRAFLKTIGVFPVGALVRLVDNSIAVVAEINKNNPLQPKVISLGLNGKSAPKLFNLNNSSIKIEAPISADELHLDPKKVLSDFVEDSLKDI